MSQLLAPLLMRIIELLDRKLTVPDIEDPSPIRIDSSTTTTRKARQ